MLKLALILTSLFLLGSCGSRTLVSQPGDTTQTATPHIDATSHSDTDSLDANNNQSSALSLKKKFNVRIAGSILTSDKCKFGGIEYLVELKQKPKDPKTLATTSVKPELIYKIEMQLPEGQYVLRLRNNRKAKVIATKTIAINSSTESLTVDFNGCP